MRIGIINGSTRSSSNTTAIVSYVVNLLETKFPSVEWELINLLTSPNHPLPPSGIDDIIPAARALDTLPGVYDNPSVQGWSKTVLGWNGVLIVSPQYNWGIPGIMKHSFDVIFNEWVGKPAGIITLGGRGGGKCADQLVEVMGGGMKMKVVGKKVAITLPGEVIRTEKRLNSEEEVIASHESEILELVKELVETAEKKE